jgi:HJR/Mrr/RecB family endonuclease
MTNRPLNFASAKEREDWIIANAQLFTTVRMIQRKYERQEHKTLKEARAHAHLLLKEDKSKPVLIYAIHDNSDTYVEMVKP